MSNDLQAVIRRNVKVLMAIKGIETSRALAREVGTNENLLTTKISGRRRWQLDDVEMLAEAFGVQPGLLLGDTATLVGASGRPPGTAAANATTGEVNHW